MPSESTIRRVLEEIDAAALDLAVGAWLFERATRDDDDLVIALDGKVLRGAWTDENQQVTLFSAMFHREGVVAQTQVPDGTNEITQVRNLLENITTTPGQTIVTLDAAHTQRETARYLQGHGIDYVMNVKRNQPTLLVQVFSRCLPLIKEDPGSVVEERSHGRIRRWTTWTTAADGIDFPNAATVAVIRLHKSLQKSRRQPSSSPATATGPSLSSQPNVRDRYAERPWRGLGRSHTGRSTAGRSAPPSDSSFSGKRAPRGVHRVFGAEQAKIDHAGNDQCE
ncbi:ISAs1 family transposase [Protofrankia symbiont of Coriaria ruscifolia]|uniref:ISAs1 family transposase n=1 Tax=Protofrankia symbiont of Coriaria ruscifolia TaxID=1306542 RepID=UPI0013EF7DD7|nr:ISAs1 family transposase [Protofrankia symbiont of Coriaria ruscifolia]